MKNEITITGLTTNTPYYDNSEFNKRISGSVTIEFVSSDDMCEFIDEDGKLKNGAFLSKVAKCFSGLLSETVSIDNKMDLNNE